MSIRKNTSFHNETFYPALVKLISKNFPFGLTKKKNIRLYFCIALPKNWKLGGKSMKKSTLIRLIITTAGSVCIAISLFLTASTPAFMDSGFCSVTFYCNNGTTISCDGEYCQSGTSGGGYVSCKVGRTRTTCYCGSSCRTSSDDSEGPLPQVDDH